MKHDIINSILVGFWVCVIIVVAVILAGKCL